MCHRAVRATTICSPAGRQNTVFCLSRIYPTQHSLDGLTVFFTDNAVFGAECADPEADSGPWLWMSQVRLVTS